eukprot:TRINITY_DN1248_c0_g2_i4.p1 TRINITY_DN1248_c0_g2~~TRINITY_DN1248_c0_g2_i4.p1  ORF type:complete len:187 (+),score=61.25 TRINITY_DN1248_c0_g2_i4:66-626(+)
MCCDDIVERYTLLLFVVVLHVLNTTKHLPTGGSIPENTLMGLVVLYLSELAVDWTKHISICNNNEYTPGFYLGKLALLKRRISESVTSRSVFADHSLALSPYVSVWVLPTVAMFVKVMHDWMYIHPYSVIFLSTIVWLGAVAIKVCNYVVLRLVASHDPLAPIDKWFRFPDIEPIDEPTEPKAKKK